jgi:hypothetical protein
MGKDSIGNFCKYICLAACIVIRCNHGIRRTVISDCYAIGMPESQIALISRHKTVEAMREYMGLSIENRISGDTARSSINANFSAHQSLQIGEAAKCKYLASALKPMPELLAFGMPTSTDKLPHPDDAAPLNCNGSLPQPAASQPVAPIQIHAIYNEPSLLDSVWHAHGESLCYSALPSQDLSGILNSYPTPSFYPSPTEFAIPQAYTGGVYHHQDANSIHHANIDNLFAQAEALIMQGPPQQRMRTEGTFTGTQGGSSGGSWQQPQQQGWQGQQQQLWQQPSPAVLNFRY